MAFSLEDCLKFTERMNCESDLVLKISNFSNSIKHCT